MELDWLRPKPKRRPEDVWTDWKAADEAGRPDRAAIFASELLDLTPNSFFSWFEAGLLSKALGDWAECSKRNARALELFTAEDAEEFGGANPAAWNLGIASTAVGDWATARRAWEAYGLKGYADEAGPIDANLGLAPVRLNPDRPSLPHQVSSTAGDPEVIWCWRRSPAHAVIASVPLPESGHRFRDVLLHDGEPKGTRMLDGREVSVFDELARLEESNLPTWQAEVIGAAPEDMEALADILGKDGLGVDEWSGIRLMCSECSHGSPGNGHSHAPAAPDSMRLGLAGGEVELSNALERWLEPRSGIELHNFTLLW